jgi:hypothetical protein
MEGQDPFIHAVRNNDGLALLTSWSYFIKSLCMRMGCQSATERLKNERNTRDERGGKSRTAPNTSY